MPAAIRTLSLLVSTTLLCAATLIVSSADEAEGLPTRSRSVVATLLTELQSTLDDIATVRQIKSQRQDANSRSETLTLDELEVKRSALVHKLQRSASEPRSLPI